MSSDNIRRSSDSEAPRDAGQGAAASKSSAAAQQQAATGTTPNPVTSTTGAVRWQPPEASTLTDSFPGLRVAALAGVGGMSAVYRAEQFRLGRTVAVKILPTATAPDQEARDRFQREARILSGLNHPHILHIHDFGALSDGTLYLVTEWAGGGDLAKLIDGNSQPPAKVMAWVNQIAEALDAAHARGIIHRDLKPANVLVLDDGRLTLSDFGLAHAAGGGFTSGLTVAGAIFGTFEYMAPEQMESADRVTPAADIYALGVMTYQMLTGRIPRGAYARPSRLSSVPVEVDAFLDASMATDPARRPKSGAEFARLFERACRARVRRRHRQVIGLGVALVALALAWARAEIRRSEHEAAIAEARSTALVAEARLNETRLAEARRERTEALAAAEAARAAQVASEAAASAAAGAAKDPAPSPEPFLPPAPISQPEVAPGIVAPPAGITPPEPAKSEAEKAETPLVPWSWVLPDVKPTTDGLAGEWKMTRGELVSGDGGCAITLPVKLAINYDVAIEFTRNSGQNSVAVFLPTLSGVGTFEVDAWDMGIAGLQMINGQDMRRTDRFFPARLENGVKHRLILEVRGARVAATWDGEPRMTWNVADQKLRIPPLWQVRPEIGLGVGTWMSPTTFHRIAYRSWPADVSR